MMNKDKFNNRLPPIEVPNLIPLSLPNANSSWRAYCSTISAAVALASSARMMRTQCAGAASAAGTRLTPVLCPDRHWSSAALVCHAAA